MDFSVRRPLGAGYGSRVSNSLPQSTFPVCRTRTGKVSRSGEPGSSGRNGSATADWSNRACDRGPEVCQPVVCGPQAGREMESHFQLEAPQPVCASGTLQNAVSIGFTRSPDPQDVSMQARLEECLPFYLSGSKGSSFPVFPSPKPGNPMAVHLPSFWSGRCAEDVYQDLVASGGPLAGVRLPGDNLPRRLAAHGFFQDSSRHYGAEDYSPSGGVGFHRKPPEVSALPLNFFDFPGHVDRHSCDDCNMARGQGKESATRVFPNSAEAVDLCGRAAVPLGENGGFSVCSSSCPPSLQGSPVYLLHDNLVPNSVLDHLPPVPLSPWAQTDLVWWTSATPSTFRSSLLVPPVTVLMATDASRAGWGAVCGNRTTGGRWHPDESKNHINWLEMRAVQLGLQAFVSQIHDTSIRLEVDNVSTVAFLNRKGGTRSQRLCHLAQEIWEWALSRSLVLVAVHVPGKSNTVADHQSRHFQRTSSDWMLNPALFRELETLLGPFKVDLFAARHNAQLKSYCSWSHDPWAIATDAFSMPALWENAYAFPPFHLVGRCLRLVREFRVRRILLVAPAWARQPWYSLLLTMLVSSPILLESAHVLLGPEGELHPVHQRLHMVAWPISGHPSDCVAFRTELRSCGVKRGGLQRQSPTTVPGANGNAGVVRGQWIPFMQICR